MHSKKESIFKLLFSILFSALYFETFSNIKIDTLCAYEPSYYEQHLTKVVIHDTTELNSFLNATGFKNSRVIKSMAANPDFKSKTCFAFAGWPCQIINIIDKKDSLIIHYKEEYQNANNNDGALFSRPASIAVIYYLPFTKRIITFFDATHCGNTDLDSLK